MWLLFTSAGWLIIGQRRRRRPKWTKCRNAAKWTWLWSTGEGKQTAGALVLKVSMACQIEYITLCCPVHFAAFHETLIRSNEGVKRKESAGRWFQKYSAPYKRVKIDHDDGTRLGRELWMWAPQSWNDRIRGEMSSYASAHAFFITPSDKLVLPANQKQR